MIIDLGATSGISKKLLFLNGKQNIPVTGGWECYELQNIDGVHDFDIGETLCVRGHYGTDSTYYPTTIVGTVNAIDLTNVKSIHFRILNLYAESPAVGQRAWRVGVASAETVESYLARYGDSAKFIACRDSQTYTGQGYESGVYTLDVSGLVGNYYVFLYASYNNDNVNGGSYLSRFEVDKILIE